MESGQDASDRRAHRRVPSSELPEQTLIRIPERQAVTLVDLSSGGALLELPFQMHPESRITLELFTAAERIDVPFQLLRCYVADLKNGVRYHAAGAFDRALKLPAALAAELTPPVDPLVAALESFLRNSQATSHSPQGFTELLGWVLSELRRGQPAYLVSRHVKTQLVRAFPSLSIGPASLAVFRESPNAARFFGFDFRSTRALSAADRRFLKATAQLLSLINKIAEPGMTQDPDSPRKVEYVTSSLVVHSAADWQTFSKGR